MHPIFEPFAGNLARKLRDRQLAMGVVLEYYEMPKTLRQQFAREKHRSGLKEEKERQIEEKSSLRRSNLFDGKIADDTEHSRKEFYGRIV